MKELTKVFNGVSIPVEVADENNMWFDVSNINREMKVKFTDWKSSKRVKETLKLIEKSTSLNRPLIDDEVYGKNYIHKKLFISYARFISVEFEIKADEIIMDILLGEKQICQKEMDLLKKENKRLKKKRNVYAAPRAGNAQSVKRIIMDYNIQITSEALNQLLYEEGMVKRQLVEVFKYTSDNMNQGTALVNTDEVLKLVDSNGYVRNTGYLDNHPQLDFKEQ